MKYLDDFVSKSIIKDGRVKIDEMCIGYEGWRRIEMQKAEMDFGGYTLDRLRRGDWGLIRMPTRQVPILSGDFGCLFVAIVNDRKWGTGTEKWENPRSRLCTAPKLVGSASLPITPPLTLDFSF